METATAYHLLTEQVLHLTGWSDKMAHLNAGLAIYVLARIVLRTRRACPQAVAVVLAIELANEVLDVLHFGAVNWAETASDIAYTVTWPAIIAGTSMYRRGRWNGAQAKRLQSAHPRAGSVHRGEMPKGARAVSTKSPNRTKVFRPPTPSA